MKIKMFYTIIALICLTIFPNFIFAQQTSIAILPIKDIETGKAVSELTLSYLEYAFVNSNKFIMVERGMINSAIQEQKLTSSDFFDNKFAAKIGKTVGAKYIIAGKLMKVDKKYILNCKLINVEKITIIKIHIEEGSKEELKDMALKVADVLSGSITGEGSSLVMNKDEKDKLKKELENIDFSLWDSEVKHYKKKASKLNKQERTELAKNHLKIIEDERSTAKWLNAIPFSFGLGSFYQGDLVGKIACPIIEGVGLIGLYLSYFENGSFSSSPFGGDGTTLGVYFTCVGFLVVEYFVKVFAFPAYQYDREREDILEVFDLEEKDLAYLDRYEKPLNFQLMISEASHSSLINRQTEKIKVSLPIVHLKF